MILVEDIHDVKVNNIVFNEGIRNSIIENNYFYKLKYSNDFMTLTNLFVGFDLDNIELIGDKLNFNYQNNSLLINKLIDLEKKILKNFYVNKECVYKLPDIFESEKIKVSSLEDYMKEEIKNLQKLENKKLVLKISGIWESDDKIGLTYKFIILKYSITFYPSVE